ncbi:heat shock protein beta-1 isoform X1 [Thrips palmi]|uniref:Heat shock protein beta-1 isoform X1 n=1 Tax=Thrips palmi TaxID=161013 RepID=A0A6P8Z510_THRPL|nr:heat shock protein beta-1 isoform X1 [Thrips palmi]
MADGGVKRDIPIKHLGDFSVLDSEFSNIRERFDNEMRKMEDEMTRFRSELMNHESNFFKTSTSHRSETSETKTSSSSTSSGTIRDSGPGLLGSTRFPNFPPMGSAFEKFSSTTSSSNTTQQGGGPIASGPASGPSTWLDGLHSPLIQEDGGDKKLKLRFDVSQYAPEEIVVKTVDNKLLVHAKHEEKTDSKSVYREYNREFLLPKGTNPESIKSSLSKDGVLTVEAPLPQAALGPAEKMIPIAH